MDTSTRQIDSNEIYQDEELIRLKEERLQAKYDKEENQKRQIIFQKKSRAALRASKQKFISPQSKVKTFKGRKI